MFLGVGINVDGDGVMVGANNSKFGKMRRFGELAVGDKKGKEVEGRERRGWRWGHTLEGGGGVILPWTPISTRGTFYDGYTSYYVLC